MCAGHPHIGVGGVPVAVRARLVRDHKLHAEGLLQDGAVEHLALQEEVAGDCVLQPGVAVDVGAWPRSGCCGCAPAGLVAAGLAAEGRRGAVTGAAERAAVATGAILTTQMSRGGKCSRR